MYEVRLTTQQGRKAICVVDFNDGEPPEVVLFCGQAFILDKQSDLWEYKEVLASVTRRLHWQN